ncbi:MAG: Flp pilus assembly complex ATPase component TadA, partial [Lachnospiraceae bacterium]|nr:Flp pilus assembly complex ATPase component TadA [Lachnospiraceae bacterium]
MSAVSLDSEPEDDTVLRLIDNCIREEAVKYRIPLKEMLSLRQELFHSLRKLDLLSELLEDETVTEIMINGYANIFVEREGRLERLPKAFISEEKLRDVVQQVVSACNRIVNEAHPVVDARLSDGSRVNVVLPPVALNGAVMTIRRFPKEPITMERLTDMGSLTKQAAKLLSLLVKSGYNIFISGGTGSGKTTVLNALSRYIPPG